MSLKKKKEKEESLVIQHLCHDMRIVGQYGKDSKSCLGIMPCYKISLLTILFQTDFVFQIFIASSQHIT